MPNFRYTAPIAMSRLEELFADSNAVDLINHKLLKLFQIVEIESSRAGKTGMEVGSLRERILKISSLGEGRHAEYCYSLEDGSLTESVG